MKRICVFAGSSQGERAEYLVTAQKRAHRAMMIVSDDPDSLLQLFEEYVPPVGEKWIDQAAT